LQETQETRASADSQSKNGAKTASRDWGTLVFGMHGKPSSFGVFQFFANCTDHGMNLLQEFLPPYFNLFRRERSCNAPLQQNEVVRASASSFPGHTSTEQSVRYGKP
jgi:hypothetical protein